MSRNILWIQGCLLRKDSQYNNSKNNMTLFKIFFPNSGPTIIAWYRFLFFYLMFSQLSSVRLIIMPIICMCQKDYIIQKK